MESRLLPVALSALLLLELIQVRCLAREGGGQYGSVHVTEREVADCLSAWGTRRYNASNGTLAFTVHSLRQDTPRDRPQQRCTVVIETQPGRWLALDNLDLSGSELCGAEVTLTGEVSRPGRPVVLSCHNASSVRRVLSTSGRLEVTLTLTFTHAWTFNFSAGFRGMAEVDPDMLQLNYTTGTSGYIQSTPPSPSWTRVHDVHTELQLWPPGRHVTVVSLSHASLPDTDDPEAYIRVSLYFHDDASDQRRLIQTLGPTDRRGPLVLDHHTVLVVYAVDSRSVGGARVKVRFSFHPRDTAPHRVDGDRWNCSVGSWADFGQHVNCDLSVDCLDGRDERECGYTSRYCRTGSLLAGDSCYTYFRQPEEVWEDAMFACQKRGMQLASFPTPQAWRTVMKTITLTAADTVFVGIRTTSLILPMHYSYSLQWVAGQAVAHYTGDVLYSHHRPACGTLHPREQRVRMGACNRVVRAGCLCQSHPTVWPPSPPSPRPPGSLLNVTPVFYPWGSATPEPRDAAVERSRTSPAVSDRYFLCPTGHLTHTFMACYPESNCGTGDHPLKCDANLTPLPPCLACRRGLGCVPYTFVCDLHVDCKDGSDEDICVHDVSAGCKLYVELECGDGQCFRKLHQCDNIRHCRNGFDELECSPDRDVIESLTVSPDPPGLVHATAQGRFRVAPLGPGWANASLAPYPATHVSCRQGRGYYYIPVYLRCNGAADCPEGEDERDCDSCPGFYRCRGTAVCLHPDHLCDGVQHCPGVGDDELLCDMECPAGCTCYGTALRCWGPSPTHHASTLRYLDGGDSGMGARQVNVFSMLLYLGLARCNLTSFRDVLLYSLLTLDLSHNRLAAFRWVDVRGMSSLRDLSLAGNPLTYLFFLQPAKALYSDSPFDVFRPLSVERFHLSGVAMPELELHTVYFPHLQVLNLSGAGVERVGGDGFQGLSQLRVLDVTGCPLADFPRRLVKGLDRLELLRADNYRLCCPAVLPDQFNRLRCYAPSSALSSCEALLRTTAYRFSLVLLAVLALVGNGCTFLVRCLARGGRSLHGFDVLVSHLCVSDLLMGVYLAIIGVADTLYQGSYLWVDSQWRASAACRAAGFLSLLSCEVSAFIVSLITLDRFLVLRFPLSHVRLGRRSAHGACLMAWGLGAALTAVPLMPALARWRFYGQTGICVPLPVSGHVTQGHAYSFAILIVLNFVLFMLIALGQLSIYCSIQANSISACDSSSHKSRDMTVARRLITVAVSDFLCWFPIGLLGLLASQGHEVSGEVNVALAIFVLPVNSALNPFLYTLNTILEKRRRMREDRLRKLLTDRHRRELQARVKVKAASDEGPITAASGEQALTLVKKWVKDGLLNVETLESCLNEPIAE